MMPKVQRQKKRRSLYLLDDISKRLIASGVSREALKTTLEREGRSDLRELLTQELYVDDTGAVRPVVFSPFPAKSHETYLRNAAYCDLVFNLFLKEALIIDGYSSGVITVQSLYNARMPDLRGSTVDVLPMGSLISFDSGNYAPFAFYPDFHPRELDTYRFSHIHVTDEIEEFILSRLYSQNIAPVLQSCVPLRQIKKDWSPKFLGILENISLVFEIQAPKE